MKLKEFWGILCIAETLCILSCLMREEENFVSNAPKLPLSFLLLFLIDISIDCHDHTEIIFFKVGCEAFFLSAKSVLLEIYSSALNKACTNTCCLIAIQKQRV